MKGNKSIVGVGTKGFLQGVGIEINSQNNYTPSDLKGKTERIGNVEVSRASRAYPANCTASIPHS